MKTFIMLLVSFFICGSIPSAVSAVEETQQVRKGIITGQLMVKEGVPMSGGFVFFFRLTGKEQKDSKFPEAAFLRGTKGSIADERPRIPEAAFPIGNDGRFTAVLAEGQYYMGALKKIGNLRLGPPEQGDLLLTGSDEKGNLKVYSVKGGETLNVDILSGALPFKDDSLAAYGTTSIQGAVLDEKGKPVEGVVVFAFVDQSMIGRPLFFSERTDKDGRYLLKIHEGKYYLRVRNNPGGGPPAKGENMGVYEGGKEVVIKVGETLKDFNIRITTFPGRGKNRDMAPQQFDPVQNEKKN